MKWRDEIRGRHGWPRLRHEPVERYAEDEGRGLKVCVPNKIGVGEAYGCCGHARNVRSKVWWLWREGSRYRVCQVSDEGVTSRDPSARCDEEVLRTEVYARC